MAWLPISSDSADLRVFQETGKGCIWWMSARRHDLSALSVGPTVRPWSMSLPLGPLKAAPVPGSVRSRDVRATEEAISWRRLPAMGKAGADLACHS